MAAAAVGSMRNCCPRHNPLISTPYPSLSRLSGYSTLAREILGT